MIKGRDLDTIIDQLMNDENSTDNEIVDFLSDETKVKPDVLKKIVKAHRDNFLLPSYIRKSQKELGQIINGSIKESLCGQIREELEVHEMSEGMVLGAGKTLDKLISNIKDRYLKDIKVIIKEEDPTTFKLINLKKKKEMQQFVIRKKGDFFKLEATGKPALA